MAEEGRRLHELFRRAIEVPTPEHDAFIKRECGDDDSLAASLRELLANDESTHERFLEGEPQPEARVSHGVSTPPEQIGPYRVIREIGRGGMGVVYEAEQESPKRRVAVKVVRTGMMNEVLVSRFKREAQMLAKLQHPGIAHIYESGSAPVGNDELPFFAMEYIDAQQLDMYVATRDLSQHQRLELLARVCDAVQHAHQKGIVHRDLKPGNVLVVEQSTGTGHGSDTSAVIDPIGQPKILDFGIARFTDPEVQATVQTSTGQIIGTLANMSPEQVGGRPEELDTRCDVYALGVMLYSMLAERPPHDLAGLPVAEAANIIKNEDPVSLGSIDPALRGDVSTIAAKAMDKDRERRYASAGLLAEDIRRHMRDEPIAARPATTIYQLRKFARRNTALVGGIATTGVVLVIGLVLVSMLLLQTAKERDAKQDALDATQVALEASDEVTQFFTDMLGSASPESRGKDVTVRAMLDLSAREIGERFADRPLIEARIRKTLGDTYLSLGEFDSAREHIEAALGLWRGQDVPSIEPLKAHLSQARIHQHRAEYDEALAQYETLLARVRGLDNAVTERLAVVDGYAGVLARVGRSEEAELLLEEAVAEFTEVLGPTHVNVLKLRSTLAQISGPRLGDKAEPLYQELIAQARGALGDEHPTTLMQIANLAAFYRGRGRAQEAIPLLREVYQSQNRVLGESHRQTLISANNLAQSLGYADRPDEAMSVLDATMKIATQSHGEESAPILFLGYTRATVLQSMRDYEAAEQAFLQSVAIHERVQGPDAEGTHFSKQSLGRMYVAAGMYDEAIAVFRGMLEHSAAALPDTNPRVYEIRYDLAGALLRSGRFAEAETIYFTAHNAADAYWKSAIERNLATLATRWDDPSESERLFHKLIQTHTEKEPPDQIQIAAIHHLRGEYQANQERWAEAEIAFHDAIRLLEQHPSAGAAEESRTRHQEPTAADLTRYPEAERVLLNVIKRLEELPPNQSRDRLLEDGGDALASLRMRWQQAEAGGDAPRGGQK